MKKEIKKKEKFNKVKQNKKIKANINKNKKERNK